MTLSRLIRALATLALTVSAVIAAVVAGEMGLRLWDAQPLLVLRLRAPGNEPPAAPHPLDATVGGALTADIDPAWIDTDPPPYERLPVDRMLLRRAHLPRGPQVKQFELFRVWNRTLVTTMGRRPDSKFPEMPQPLFVFDTPDHLGNPTHRYADRRH